MKQRLIIDGQILQTGAWHRGMGKYTMQVLRQLDQNPPPGTEVALLFNTKLPRDQLRFDTIRYLCPSVRQLHGELPLATDKRSSPQEYQAQLDRCVRREFPNSEIFYLITGLFLFDFFAEFPSGSHGLLLFYDLTPLLCWRDLGGYFPPELYMQRFQKLFEAERIFAISETTRQDLLKIFGLPPRRLANVNGGFTRIATATKEPTGFTVPPEYVLFPTGDLPHKNNELAVHGFEQYCQENRPTKLLITSHFSKESKQYLRSISGNIVFTNNVSDEELEWLYEHAALVLFASKYEGLGLPILDAVASQKPVVASRIPVFEEMSPDAFYYFDPTSANSLASALQAAFARQTFSHKRKKYPAIMQKYTWSNTVDGIRDYVASSTHLAAEPVQPAVAARQRLAVVGLHPGIAGHIGRLAEPLYYSLRERFTVDYYFDGNGEHYRDMERPTFLDQVACKTFDITKLDLRSYRGYAGVVYLLDEHALPSRAAQRAAVLPGIAITSSMAQFDRQQELFKTLVVDNQYVVHHRPTLGYSAYQKLAAAIAADVDRQLAHPRPEQLALRHGTKRRIMKKLQALHKR